MMSDQDSLQAELKELKKKVDDYGERVSRIDSHFKVALTLAVVFGIVGAWGYRLISSVRSEIEGMKGKMEEVKGEAEKVRKQAEELAGTFAALKENQIPQLEGSLRHLELNTLTTSKQAELIAAEMRERAALEILRLQDQSRNASDSLEKTRRDTETQIGTSLEKTLSDFKGDAQTVSADLHRARQEGLEEVQRQIKSTLAGTVANPAWKDCVTQKIGIDRTHQSDGGPWCPKGKFVVQLNFDAKKLTPEVFVREAVCCAPAFEL